MKKYFLIFGLLIFGCKNQIEKQQYVEVFDYQQQYVEISQFEFEEILGHNAASAQFGCSGMLIDTSNFKVVSQSLSSDENENESGYTQGYHKALKQIYDEKNVCPDLH